MNPAQSGEDHSAWIQQDVERLLYEFEDAWQQSEPPDLAQFLTGRGGQIEQCDRRSILEELVKIDMEYRWRRRAAAARPDDATIKADEVNQEEATIPAMLYVEDFVRSYPELADSLDLIAEEYRIRHRWGDAPSHAEYERRFRQHAGPLVKLLTSIDDELNSEAGKEAATHESDVVLVPPDGAVLASTDAAKPSTQVNPPTVASTLDKTMRDAQGKLPDRLGRYDIRSLLGTGGFGSVYLARDPQLDRLVAIKVLHPHYLRKKSSQERFLNEARLAAKIQHPALVSIYDVDFEGDLCYLVMQYIQGQPLHDVLRSTIVPPVSAARLLAELSDAVHEAHKAGLVHRDLKPANILIDSQGHPHITDFGLAIHEDQQRRKAGEIAGTPYYMAPEQVRGLTHQLDGRTDLWSLGVVLYELLTARCPFSGADMEQVFDEIQNREPKPPRQIDDEIPTELERICLKCLSKDIKDRYTNGKDLADELRNFIDNVKDDAKDHPSASDKSTVTTATTNLPRSTDRFVGRQHELNEISGLLRDESSTVVTLIGPGGIGKTRLATEVGRAMIEDFPGGCWWIELEKVTTASEISHSVLKALGVPIHGEQDATELVASVLEYRKPLVLILDNFEQAIEHAPATVGAWRSHAPHVHFLATSRAPLGLSGERQYELEPLAVPSSPGKSSSDVNDIESVKLFVERAREVDTNFVLDDSNSADIAEICVQLEGIPLAVELAASRIAILKPAQLLKRLGQKFQLLKSTHRDRTSRQQTLEGAIEWSYNLLTECEQHAFVQLSIFADGFFLDAAEAAVDVSKFDDSPLVFEVVQSLREKCLLRTSDSTYELRFDMYKSIRDYGERKRQTVLSEKAQAELAKRVATCLIEYAESWDEKVHSPDGLEALDRISLETQNLFAIQDRALASKEFESATRAILAMAELSVVRGVTDEYVRRLALSSDGASESLETRRLIALSQACRANGDWDRAFDVARQAVESTKDLGASSQFAQALHQYGEMCRLRGQVDEALESFQQSERVSREVGARRELATAVASRGFVVWQQGNVDEALGCYSEAATIAQQLGDEEAIAKIARSRGYVLFRRNDYDGAMACFAEAEAIAHKLGDRHTMYLAISGRGTVLSERGDYEAALSCYEAAEKITRDIGEKRGIAVNQGNRGLALADLGKYEEALEFYAAAEKINREMGTVSGFALNIGNRGVALMAMDDLEQAHECLIEAERLHRQTGNRMQIAINLGDRGAVLQRMEKLDDARDVLRQSLKIFNELNLQSSHDYFCFQTTLASVESKLGNSAEAIQLAESSRRLAQEIGLTDQHPRVRIREDLAALREL